MRTTTPNLFFRGIIFPLLLLINTVSSRAQETFTASSYIETFKDAAIENMEEHGCPASVILAVAMHESAHGNSKVAQHLNNHFGIKGQNNSTAIRSAYKGYEDVADSYNDFIGFLKRRKTTQHLFNTYGSDDYEAWVQAIARSGYAQSRTWATQVLAMIRKYGLHTFDKPSDKLEASTAAPGQDLEIDTNAAIYIVKKGDTLSAIAKKHQTTVKSLQQKNHMKHTKLKIGQRLSI